MHPFCDVSDASKVHGREEFWVVLYKDIEDKVQRNLACTYLWRELHGRIESNQYIGAEMLSMPFSNVTAGQKLAI